VEVRGSGERALVDVADTGPGVPAAEQTLIFERFGRGDASRSRNTGGAGLGLPIARGLAVAHGGELSYVESPAGARFRVDLPAAT
jgi:two-component system OmpR family sensor kinase